MRKIKYLILVLLLTFNNNLSQELVWKHLGGPYGGIIDAMAINSKGDLFAGTYTFGISSYGAYKSIDNGETWIKLATEFPEYEVYSLLVTKEDYIWIGTRNNRLYRSTDNGLTWENKTSGFVGECWALGESKSGTLFAGDAERAFLFRSTNKGDSWQFVMNNITPLCFAADSNNKMFMGTMNGLYYSTNNGQNWFRDNSFPNYFVSSILIDSNNIIYCATGYSYSNGDGVFYSTNGGLSWTHLGLSTKAILSLAVDSEGKLYAGSRNDGIYVTNDNGNSWTILQKGLDRKQISQLIINKNNEIFVGSEGGGEGLDIYSGGGVFRSTDNGSFFEHVGLPFNLVKNSVFSGDSLIITATLSGLQTYNRSTEKWSNKGLHNVEAVTITPSGYLYAGTDIGLYKKHISSEDWEYLDIAEDTVLTIYNVLAIDDNIIFASTNSNLRRTTDGGSTWQKLNIRTGSSSQGLFYKNNILYITGYLGNSSNLLKSSDLGNNFTLLFPNYNTQSIKKHFTILTNSNLFTITTGSSTFNGIIRSTDDGNNWNYVYSNVRSPSIIFSDNNDILLSGLYFSSVTDTSKLLISTNSGANWKEFPILIEKKLVIFDIVQDKLNKYFIGTNGYGLFELDIITSVKQEETIPKNFSLSQNFPNPFNPFTTIEFVIASDNGAKQSVQLKVYDILGNEVATLVNEFKSAGSYSVSFSTGSFGDGSKLSSGIYYYKLTAGDFVNVKKMLLLK